METVIVTGAASGIGKAIVEQCQATGYHTIACDLDLDGLRRLKEGFPSYRGEIAAFDIADYDAVERFFNGLAISGGNEYGLVNNAGIYYGKNLCAYEKAELDRVVDVNIKGALYCSRFFAQLLRRSGAKGRIVNISSVSGQEGSSDAVYGMSKAALLGLTKSCAMNFAPDILVNAVAPTMVNTAMMGIIPDWRKEEYNNHNLIKEPVSPQDVADTVLFLLSGKAAHYTGATFDLNNGGYLR